MEHNGKGTDRRTFMASASAAATALIVAHEGFPKDPTPLQSNRPAVQPRILSLELQTAAPLARMKEFYHETLGLAVIEDRTERLVIAAGDTRLQFTAAGGRARPFYHFAFNIPENKIRPARDWQRQRTALLPIPARLRDANFPDDVVNYSHWNAHSVFFFDPAGNVAEYIARHDLRNASPGPFSSRDILYVSEIAFVVDQVGAVATRLGEMAGLRSYRGSSDQFHALGDEHGLVLVMRRGRVISFDSPERKAVDVFRTGARIRGNRSIRHRIADFPYELTVQA